MIDPNIIGRRSQPVMNLIEAEAVKRFAETIGIPYEGEVPPTFLYTLKSGEIPGLNLPRQGLIHAGQAFTYYQKIAISEVLMCSRKVIDQKKRRGKLGVITFVTIETEGRNLKGELVYTATSTLILREEGDA